MEMSPLQPVSIQLASERRRRRRAQRVACSQAACGNNGLIKLEISLNFFDRGAFDHAFASIPCRIPIAAGGCGNPPIAGFFTKRISFMEHIPGGFL